MQIAFQLNASCSCVETSYSALRVIRNSGGFLPSFSPVEKDSKEVVSITERTSYDFSHLKNFTSIWFYFCLQKCAVGKAGIR